MSGRTYESLKRRVRRLLPEPLLVPLANAKAQVKIAAARVAFARSQPAAGPLPVEILSRLLDNYREPDKVGYDSEGVVLRAADKIVELRQVTDFKRVQTVLELGCWDGMTLAELAKHGIRAFGLDLNPAGFDPRAAAAGVTFIQASATSLPFAAATFDLLYSFASFEHFSEPEATIREAARVLRPGGRLHLVFGPIAMAPHGLHAYRSIPVPYIQILFAKDDLIEFARAHGKSYDWPYINGFSLRGYRHIFKNAEREFRRIHYEERPTGGFGAELIVKYPGSFRRVSDCFEDFLVSVIAVTLERR